MRFCITIIALLCSCTSLLAQKPLHIGDQVPDVQFDKLINHSAPTASLSDFKGRLVIIDFWATWCSSCLHAFGKLDSLQAVFPGQLKIILVNTQSTGDDLSKVQGFFSKWKARTGKRLSLPAVVNDTIMDGLFPHMLIPHYVWISKEGKLIAISSSDAVTAANIQAAWKGEELPFTMKKDQDASRPVFSTADLPADKLLNYCVFTKGWFDGLPSGNRVRQKEDVICGRAMTNTSLLDMFKTVAAGIDSSFNEKRLMVSAADSSDLFPPLENEGREAWYKQHAYTLDMVVPIEEAGQLYQRMLEVLNRYSGYTGRFGKRKMNCWVLLRKRNTMVLKTNGYKPFNNLWAKDSPFLRNGTIGILVKRLNRLPVIQYPVLDETAWHQNMDICFPEGLNDLKTIREQLAKCGLILRQEERVVKLFVVQKK
jgi:thiol-disulfide isomerase/thioredoxin